MDHSITGFFSSGVSFFSFFVFLSDNLYIKSWFQPQITENRTVELRQSVSMTEVKVQVYSYKAITYNLQIEKNEPKIWLENPKTIISACQKNRVLQRFLNIELWYRSKCWHAKKIKSCDNKEEEAHHCNYNRQTQADTLSLMIRFFQERTPER